MEAVCSVHLWALFLGRNNWALGRWMRTVLAQARFVVWIVLAPGSELPFLSHFMRKMESQRQFFWVQYYTTSFPVTSTLRWGVVGHAGYGRNMMSSIGRPTWYHGINIVLNRNDHCAIVWGDHGTDELNFLTAVERANTRLWISRLTIRTLNYTRDLHMVGSVIGKGHLGNFISEDGPSATVQGKNHPKYLLLLQFPKMCTERMKIIFLHSNTFRLNRHRDITCGYLCEMEMALKNHLDNAGGWLGDFLLIHGFKVVV